MRVTLTIVSSKVEGRPVAWGSLRQRLLEALLSRPAAWRAELPSCAALLAGVAFLLYRPHVEQGGFYYDDWSHASDYHDQGWRMAVNLWHHVLPGRPALAALLPLPDALFGDNAEAHLAMAVCLGALTSLCFYVFLRALTLEPIHAAIIAVLERYRLPTHGRLCDRVRGRARRTVWPGGVRRLSAPLRAPDRLPPVVSERDREIQARPRIR